MAAPLQSQLETIIERFYNARTDFAREIFGITPWSEQEKIFTAADTGERRLAVKSGHRIGKGHPLHLLIDTPEGRKRWGDLRPGDQLFGPTGPVRILHTTYRGIQPCYRVHFTDGTSTETDGAHLWFVHERREQTRLLTTEMMWQEGTHRRNGKTVAARWRLPSYQPVEYEAEAPFDPYLFGVWLGDGAKEGQITGHAIKGREIIGVNWKTRPAKPNTATGSIPGLRTALRKSKMAGLGSHERFLPPEYRFTRSQDRHAILQGLLDTDGTADTHGMVTFCSTSHRLAADVAWLVRSLGGRASEHPTPKKAFYYLPNGERHYGRLAYLISICMPEHLPPFRMASKLKRLRPRSESKRSRFVQRVEPMEPQITMCVTVDNPDGLYLTNDFLVTHNSLANAVLIWHHLICRYPQKCAVTAPSEKHLFDALWAEFRGLGNRFTKDYLWLRDLYDITAERAVMKSHPAESFVSIKVSRPEQTEALQGMYSENVLLIADEASGVPEATFEAAMSSMANPHILFVMTSQPIRTSGFFADAFRKNPEMWWKKTISSLDSPFVDPDYINFVKEKYGEDSNAYRIRVLGEFPTAEEDKVIPRDLIEAATQRKVDISPSASVVWGLDVGIVARSALAKRQGNGLKEPVRHWRKLDTMETAGRVKHEWDVTPQKDRPIAICIDAIGLGRGVADRLRELGLPSRAINVSETPALIHPHYKDLRSELWFAVREWLANRDTVIPDQEELIDELAAPDIKYYSSGKTGAEPKDSMKRRGVESPDLADALALTFAVDATVLMGRGSEQDWNLPPDASPWRIKGLV